MATIEKGLFYLKRTIELRVRLLYMQMGKNMYKKDSQWSDVNKFQYSNRLGIQRKVWCKNDNNP